MLEIHHSKLKKIVSFFFTAWRLDFLRRPKWRLLNILKLSIYPVYIAYGWFCVVWHLFVQIEDYSDLIDIAFTITFVVGLYQCLMIYLVIAVYNKDRIMDIFKYFENLITSRDDLMSNFRSKHFEISTRIALICAKYFLSATFVSWIVIILYCMHRTGCSSPMLFYTPGLPRESIFFYPGNIIHQTVLFFTGYELIMFSDVVIMITIICCQAELEAIAELFSLLNDEVVAIKHAGIIIKKAYDVHLILADQAKKLTMSFWHIYLQKLLCLMLYLCSMLLVFQSLSEAPYVAVLSILVMMAQVCILCFFGQMLRDSSDRMAEAVYMTKWYEMEVKDQRDILLLMMRFHHPVKVETFGFGIISLYTFVQICKASVSYAAILYTVFQ